MGLKIQIPHIRLLDKTYIFFVVTFFYMLAYTEPAKIQTI